MESQPQNPEFRNNPENLLYAYHKNVDNSFELTILFVFFTSQSTIFQLCQDRSSWVVPVLSRD